MPCDAGHFDHLRVSREVAELERRRREARTTGARAIEGRGHVEDVVPAHRADLRERVGDAVAFDVGVGGDLGEGRHRAADCEERRGRVREREARPRQRQVRGGRRPSAPRRRSAGPSRCR